MMMTPTDQLLRRAIRLPGHHATRPTRHRADLVDVAGGARSARAGWRRQTPTEVLPIVPARTLSKQELQ
jgi:hypothetical protein